MFLTHYDKSFINCSNIQMDRLVHITKLLFFMYNESEITEGEIIESFYKDNDVFYSGKFLFQSKKSLDELHANYCNLARLIYIYYCGNKYPMELDSIISSLCIGMDNINIDLIYSEYF